LYPEVNLLATGGGFTGPALPEEGYCKS